LTTAAWDRATVNGKADRYGAGLRTLGAATLGDATVSANAAATLGRGIYNSAADLRLTTRRSTGSGPRSRAAASSTTAGSR
jgi:hypothetical protein